MKNYDKEIEELETKIKILKEEKKKQDLLRPNYRLAELIHSKMCLRNHIDGCSWDYSSWEKPDSSRDNYLKKANKILEKVSFDQAYNVITNL